MKWFEVNLFAVWDVFVLVKLVDICSQYVGRCFVGTLMRGTRGCFAELVGRIHTFCFPQPVDVQPGRV